MELNKYQLEAVEHLDGPCFVTSTAGSGKTRTLVERVVRLIEKGVNPKNIVCITFTNKAANEMKSRICKRLGIDKPGFFIGTFHALCASLLRKIGDRRGYNPNFNILDETDQLDLILQVGRRLGASIARGDASNIKYHLNFYRDNLEDISSIEDKIDPFFDIAHEYSRVAKENNCIDFSGLIYETIKVIEENEDIRSKIQNNFKYILVDETQDTNYSQYHLVELMGAKWKNIMLIGDPNQSIYKWRGARYQNILDFLSNYSGVKIITLSKNYRSTPQIISASEKLIKHNKTCFADKFETDNPDGEKIRCHEMIDPTGEARWIANEIQALKSRGGWDYKDVAILYRMNKMSEPIEQVFSTRGIPYEVIGGFSFYDRKEVKDCLAMLKYLVNRKDGVAFHRVCSLVRGLGDVTVGNIENVAIERNCTLDKACLIVKENSRSIAIKDACQKIYNAYNSSYDKTDPSKCLNTLVKEFNMENVLRNKYGDEYLDRMENVVQVIEASGEFSNQENGIEKYLQQISLVTNADKEVKGDKVSLMTIHASKGLEFEILFVIGFEENIIPHIRSIKENDGDVEEERRIAYVSITRCKKILYITYCRQRRSRGKYNNMYTKICLPSIFLQEAGLINNKKRTLEF